MAGKILKNIRRIRKNILWGFLESVLGLNFPISRFLYRPALFCMKMQHSGKSSNFVLMFIVYDELMWKEIRGNSPEDIYSDFYKEKGRE